MDIGEAVAWNGLGRGSWCGIGTLCGCPDVVTCVSSTEGAWAAAHSQQFTQMSLIRHAHSHIVPS